jgi:hypothetical protein
VVFGDVERAVRDVYWAKEQGMGGIVMPALYPDGTYFFDPVLDPVWAAIQETGLPVSQHGGVGAPAYRPPGLAAILTLAYEHAFFSSRTRRWARCQLSSPACTATATRTAGTSFSATTGKASGPTSDSARRIQRSSALTMRAVPTRPVSERD